MSLDLKIYKIYNDIFFGEGDVEGIPSGRLNLDLIRQLFQGSFSSSPVSVYFNVEQLQSQGVRFTGDTRTPISNDVLLQVFPSVVYSRLESVIKSYDFTRKGLHIFFSDNNFIASLEFTDALKHDVLNEVWTYENSGWGYVQVAKFLYKETLPLGIGLHDNEMCNIFKYLAKDTFPAITKFSAKELKGLDKDLRVQLPRFYPALWLDATSNEDYRTFMNFATYQYLARANYDYYGDDFREKLEHRETQLNGEGFKRQAHLYLRDVTFAIHRIPPFQQQGYLVLFSLMHELLLRRINSKGVPTNYLKADMEFSNMTMDDFAMDSVSLQGTTYENYKKFLDGVLSVALSQAKSGYLVSHMNVKNRSGFVG